MFRKALLATVGVIALGSTAFAADLPIMKGPPAYLAPPPIFTWTGVYIGGQVGYQWGGTTTDIYNSAGSYTTTLPNYSPDGIIGGAHLGYNFQMTDFVVGLEGDIDGSSDSGSASAFGYAPAFSAYSTKIPVEGSIRGRIGYTFDHVLLYGTGGLALANIKNSYTSPATAGIDSFSTVRTGWTAGAGIEYALDPNWSMRAEYRYTDFGHYNDTFVSTYPGYDANTHVYDNSVRLGFSYRFDMSSPIIAKY